MTIKFRSMKHEILLVTVTLAIFVKSAGANPCSSLQINFCTLLSDYRTYMYRLYAVLIFDRNPYVSPRKVWRATPTTGTFCQGSRRNLWPCTHRSRRAKSIFWRAISAAKRITCSFRVNPDGNRPRPST